MELHGDLSVAERLARVLDALKPLSDVAVKERWDSFYADRGRQSGVFGSFPDDNLAGWVEGGPNTPGRALDVGCGNVAIRFAALPRYRCFW